MEYTLRYCSSRADVWRRYWKVWRERYWVLHALLAALLAYPLSGSGLHAVHPASWALWFIPVLLAVTAIFASVPLLMFKSAQRTLKVDSRGWVTWIGKQSGARTWAEVAAIQEDGSRIILAGKNGNALIIPQGAFVDHSARKQFIEDIQHWKHVCSS